MANGLLPHSRDLRSTPSSSARLSILSTFVDRKGHAAHWCARAWSWLILATTGVEVTVKGLERLKPGDTYMFVSNHQSIYDTPVIFASLPYQLRIIAKESLAEVSVPRVAPHAARPSARRSAAARSRRGFFAGGAGWSPMGPSLIIFAEGTRSRRRARGPVQGRELSAGARGRFDDRAAVYFRQPLGDAEGPLATRPGHVTFQVHEPVAAPRIESPTIADARDLAARIEQIVRSGVYTDHVSDEG